MDKVGIIAAMASTSPNVAFNAHLLAGGATYRSAGISVYIAGLLRHLGTTPDALRYHILLGDGDLPDGVTLPFTRSRFSTRDPRRRIVWEQVMLPIVLRRLGADLCHGPAFAGALLTRCPQVITIHDLSFLRHPEFFRRGNRTYLSLISRLSCRRAAGVIAVSDFTAREAMSLLALREKHVTTVYSGVAPRFRVLPEADVTHFRKIKGLPERFILYLGTLEPRKNLARLVRSFALARDPDLHLVIAGGRGWAYDDVFEEVERQSLGQAVHFAGYVPAGEQALWYNAAHAFAYVSTYEGFGLPVLEALACGVPTVTSSTTSLLEAGGECVLAVSPDDDAEIAAALRRVTTDADLRDRLRTGGLARVGTFSWEETARRTEAVYQAVLNGSPA